MPQNTKKELSILTSALSVSHWIPSQYLMRSTKFQIKMKIKLLRARVTFVRNLFTIGVVVR